MDALRGLPGVTNGLAVGERQAGRQQADAFRRALQQHGDGQPPADSGAAEPPAPPRLQRRAPDGRREDHEVRHIDVYA